MENNKKRNPVLLVIIIILFVIVSVYFLLIRPSLGPRPSDPFLVIDSKNDVHLFWTEDTKNNDGQGDILYYTKIDNEGNRIINKKEIISVDAVVDPVALINSNDEISLFWFNPDYSKKEQSHSLPVPDIGTVKYMKLDNEGNILQNDKDITDTIFSNENLINSDEIIKLSGDNNSIEKDKELHGAIYEEYLGDTQPNWFIRFKNVLDENGNKYVFATDCNASGSFICVKKLNSNNEVIFNEKIFSIPIPQNCRGLWDCNPTFYSKQLKLDNNNNINVSFYMNNGFNKFSIHYIKLNNDGQKIIEDMEIE